MKILKILSILCSVTLIISIGFSNIMASSNSLDLNVSQSDVSSNLKVANLDYNETTDTVKENNT